MAALPVAAVGLVAGDVTGVGALRRLADGHATPPAASGNEPAVDLPGLIELIDELGGDGNGVVMTMGNGGVGKTTLAAAATGPDDEGQSLLQEDLRSPCTDEIAVFRAFARTVDSARDRVVVLDTAPTGHTLLLLDAAQSYQREVQRTNADVPDAVHEADRLQADLRRARIEPFGWVINASLAAATTTHPVLRARADSEHAHIARVEERSGHGTWLVSWQLEAPIGVAALRQLAAGADRPTTAGVR